MKKVLFLLFISISFLNCENTDPEIDATLIGRWHVEGFEDNVMYEFTEDIRYTIYGTGGVFPEVDPATHPITLAHDWVYDGDVVVIDLNFGNYSRLIPTFKCGNQVIDWTEEDGSPRSSTYFREGYDLADCEE